MASRSKRASIAQETVAISHTGTYRAPSGATVDIKDAIAEAVEGTTLITPGDVRGLRERARIAVVGRTAKTTFEVQNETTFAAAARLVSQYGNDRVAALNFASAKNPGGGFLGGSQAQEESLARGSALYTCLMRQPTYYDLNRAEKSLLYTDHLIVSPRVPVFRDDEDALLETPYRVTILTSPAPNAGAIEQNQPKDLDKIEDVFRRRIAQVLAVAVVHDQTALVLGAWGCGVFRNDPAMVARLFAEALKDGGPFATAFYHVAFAVLDRTGETLAAFAERFA